MVNFEEDAKLKLGEILLEAKLITQEQLKTALSVQKTTGQRLGVVIESLGYVDEETMINFVAKQQELPIINLEEMILPTALIKKLPRQLIEKYGCLPVGIKDDILTVVMSDPTDYEAIEEIQLVGNWRVEVVLAPRSVIKETIEDVLGPLKAEVTLESVNQKLNGLIQLLIDKKVITWKEVNEKPNRPKSK